MLGMTLSFALHYVNTSIIAHWSSTNERQIHMLILDMSLIYRALKKNILLLIVMTKFYGCACNSNRVLRKVSFFIHDSSSDYFMACHALRA